MSASHSHGPGVPNKAPKTITPWGEIAGSTLILLLLSGGLTTLGFLFVMETKDALLWSASGHILILGLLIMGGVIMVETPDYHARPVFNNLTKKRRVLFSGPQLKHWYESSEDRLVNLKEDIHSDKPPAAVTTNDPAETMLVDLLIHIRVLTGISPEQDAENVLKFISITKNALVELVYGEVFKMFSGYYGGQEMEALLNTREVQVAVLEKDKTNRDRIKALEEMYGVHIGITLQSSVPDEATKKLKATVARAEGFVTAASRIKAGIPGLDPVEVRDAALLLDEVAEYSEAKHGINIDIDAKGLENMEQFIVPPNILGGETKSPKKGGKQ